MDLKKLYSEKPELFQEVISSLSPKNEQLIVNRIISGQTVEEMTKGWNISVNELFDEYQIAVMAFVEAYLQIESSYKKH